MMNTRQEQLLTAILKEYVGTAEPVSSGFLAEKTKLDLSPATIRHELAELEELGFLQQPYTSAGRIPTEKAWRWYTKNLQDQQELQKTKEKDVLEVIHTHRETQSELMRHVARTIAHLAQETVLVGFNRHDTYYTGLSNLFAHPEFEHLDMVQQMSKVIDRFDEVMERMYDQVEEDIQVLVGRDNPFSPECGAILARYRIRDHHGVIGILGPIRQDYDQHIAMIRFATKQLNSLE